MEDAYKTIKAKYCQAIVNPKQDNKFKGFVHGNQYSEQIRIPAASEPYHVHKQYEHDCVNARKRMKESAMRSLNAKLRHVLSIKGYKGLKPMGTPFNTGHSREEDLK